MEVRTGALNIRLAVKPMTAFIYLLFSFALIIPPNFIWAASCTPLPDMEGVMQIKNCKFHSPAPLSTKTMKTSPPVNHSTSDDSVSELAEQGIQISGLFRKAKFIESRITTREPRPRRPIERSKELYDKTPDQIEMSVFFKTNNKYLCRRIKSGSKIKTKIFFTCCAQREQLKAPCIYDINYYTEELQPPR